MMRFLVHLCFCNPSLLTPKSVFLGQIYYVFFFFNKIFYYTFFSLFLVVNVVPCLFINYVHWMILEPKYIISSWLSFGISSRSSNGWSSGSQFLFILSKWVCNDWLYLVIYGRQCKELKASDGCFLYSLRMNYSTLVFFFFFFFFFFWSLFINSL